MYKCPQRLSGFVATHQAQCRRIAPPRLAHFPVSREYVRFYALSRSRTAYSGPSLGLETDSKYLGYHKPRDSSCWGFPVDDRHLSTAPQIELSPLTTYPDANLESTRPAPLELPSRPEPEAFGGSLPLKVRGLYYVNLGKSYLRFYKAGLKRVWANYKETRESWPKPAKLSDGSTKRYSVEMMVLHGGTSDPYYQMRQGVSEALVVPSISRKQYQLRLRAYHDIKKCFPFLLVFAVFGEFTPFAVWLLGSAVVPTTCQLPSQRYDEFKKTLKRRAKAQKNGQLQELESMLVDLEATKVNLTATPVSKSSFAQAMRQHFLHTQRRTDMLLAYCKGLTSLSRPIPVISYITWMAWIRPKLLNRGQEILFDMILVRREGGYERLVPAELAKCVLLYQNEGALQLLQEGEWDPLDLKDEAKDKLVALLEAQADAVLSYNLVGAPAAAAAYVALIT